MANKQYLDFSLHIFVFPCISLFVKHFYRPRFVARHLIFLNVFQLILGTNLSNIKCFLCPKGEFPIKEKLKDLRIENDLSMQELADQTGIFRIRLGDK